MNLHSHAVHQRLWKWRFTIKDLVSNQDYQRNLSWAHVKKAVEDFDLNQVNPIKVSRRNGVNYVFNGQHTAEIIALASGSRNTPVWCMIYDDLDYSVEADIFANQISHISGLFRDRCNRTPKHTSLQNRHLMNVYSVVKVLGFLSSVTTRLLRVIF